MNAGRAACSEGGTRHRCCGQYPSGRSRVHTRIRPPAVSDALSPPWHGGGRVTGRLPRAACTPGVLAKSTCLCCVAFLFYAQGIKVQAARPALQVTLLCAVLEADRGQSPHPTSRHAGIVQSSANFPETHSSLVIGIVRPDDIRSCSC